MPPAGYAAAVVAHPWDAVVFDGVTPAEMPKANALYLDPRGPGSPVKVKEALKSPGFDRLDRRHPALRFTALDDVNIAAGHRLEPGEGDKVLGASNDGAAPILVAGSRGGYKFVAVGFDVRDSDLPLRPAWPLFVLDCIDWFDDEDARYLSSFRTGEVWRIPVPASVAAATVAWPDGSTRAVAVHEGRAVMLGEHSGFYRVSYRSPEPGGPEGGTTFAANLLDPAESAIASQDRLFVDGKDAGETSPFHLGVRREIWMYLLLAAALLTALEWATYHRRVTV